MATYLLTWNSDPVNWDDLSDDLIKIREDGVLESRWSSGNRKTIVKGDRVFLIKLGKEPRGIMASGWAASNSYEDTHWNLDLPETKTANYINVSFDTILEPTNIFPTAFLEKGILAKMNWSPFASGTVIPDEIADELEDRWAEFRNAPRISREDIFPDESDTELTYIEGATKTTRVNYYERDKQAREACINRYGLNCSVCYFNFEDRYGNIGKGFIHVHHLKPLSEVGKQYRLNPIKDLRPVCPNCHAMLHKRKPAYSIGELKNHLRNKKV